MQEWGLASVPYYEYWLVPKEDVGKFGSVRRIASITSEGASERPIYNAEEREALAQYIAAANPKTMLAILAVVEAVQGALTDLENGYVSAPRDKLRAALDRLEDKNG